MADVDVDTEVAAGAQPKKRTFRKFSYRGVDLDALLDMSTDDLVQMFPARARRRFKRGLKRKPMALVKKLRKAVSCPVLFLCFRFMNILTDITQVTTSLLPYTV
uniref:40S ribosomal protein S15 n=1 Tax=Triticum urartu TaxID=4572 RepID=A0A8R7PDR2_TRIUA